MPAPRFGFSAMPDQYTLAALRAAAAPARRRAPVMAEVELTSSHGPWAPLPTTVEPAALGDGSVYDAIKADAVTASAAVERPGRGPGGLPHVDRLLPDQPAVVRGAEEHDDDLVVVMLGDHQPSTIVSGSGGNADVPVTVLAQNPLGGAASYGDGGGRPVCGPGDAGAGLADGRLPRPLPHDVQQSGTGRDRSLPSIRGPGFSKVTHVRRWTSPPADRATSSGGRGPGPSRPGSWWGRAFVTAGEVLELARRAGIGPGVRVLDLCCGVAGPGLHRHP